MKKRKTTEKEQQFIIRITDLFIETETALRAECDTYFEPDELSMFFSIALVNYVGNFIHQHSRSVEGRNFNFTTFIENLKEWKIERDKLEH